MIRVACAAVFSVICLASFCVSAQELAYVSDEELVSELNSRQEDVRRTKERIANLIYNENEAVAKLEQAKMRAKRVDEIVVKRTRLLYRMSRQGGSLRFLLGSSSTPQLLKRISTLKRLLLDGIEDRRQTGIELADATAKLQSILVEKKEAFKLLSMYEQMLDELTREQLRRSEEGQVASRDENLPIY